MTGGVNELNWLLSRMNSNDYGDRFKCTYLMKMYVFEFLIGVFIRIHSYIHLKYAYSLYASMLQQKKAMRTANMGRISILILIPFDGQRWTEMESIGKNGKRWQEMEIDGKG